MAVFPGHEEVSFFTPIKYGNRNNGPYGDVKNDVTWEYETQAAGLTPRIKFPGDLQFENK